MAASDALFQKLADALSRPSKTYQAAIEGLDIPKQAIEGYRYGSGVGDEIRQRKLKQQTLSEALGGKPPEEGLMNLTGEEGAIQHSNLAIWAAMEKARKEGKDNKAMRFQQIPNQLFNGRPGLFNPSPDIKNHMFYADTMEPINFGSTPPGTSGAPAVITPRVAPTVPNEGIDFNTRAKTLKSTLDNVKQTFRPDYVGPVSGRVGAFQDKYISSMANPDRSLFRNRVAKAFNNLIYLRTGKQLNESESDRMAEEFIARNNTPVAFQSALQSMEEEMNSLVGTRNKEYAKAGYRVGSDPGSASPSSPSTPAGNHDPLGLFQ